AHRPFACSRAMPQRYSSVLPNGAPKRCKSLPRGCARARSARRQCGFVLGGTIDPVQIVELSRLDPVEMGADLAARGLHVGDVAAGLVDVAGERAHAVVEAVEVLRQLAERILDDMDLLARLDVLEYR